MDYETLVSKIEHNPKIRTISLFSKTPMKFRILPAEASHIPQLFKVRYDGVDALIQGCATWYTYTIEPILVRFYNIWDQHPNAEQLFAHPAMHDAHDTRALKAIAKEFKKHFTDGDRPELLKLSYSRAEDIQRYKSKL